MKTQQNLGKMDWKLLHFYANEHRKNVCINALIHLPRVQVSITSFNNWRQKLEYNVIRKITEILKSKRHRNGYTVMLAWRPWQTTHLTNE